jgi:membrane-associated phospholipid phosphatase
VKTPQSGSDAPARQLTLKETAVAKAAQLTPIRPSPSNPLKPAFQLYAEIDLPIVGVAGILAAMRLIPGKAASCAPLCDSSGLNFIDKPIAGRWNPGWSTFTDFAVPSLGLASALLLAIDEGPRSALNDLTVVAESVLIATAVGGLATIPVGRPRPFLYGTTAPLEDRQSSDGSLSFVSGHTTVAFAFATSTYMAARRLHPAGPAQYIVLGVGLAGASAVAVGRVVSGKHFPTDVLAGAVVGSSIGVLIPALHGSPVRVVPVVSSTVKGALAEYVF